MFNGRPATHADVLAGLTFERTVGGNILAQLKADTAQVAALLGAGGVRTRTTVPVRCLKSFMMPKWMVLVIQTQTLSLGTGQ